jgi:lipopolysaccharide/colanic/teichoic acid biosynthesis glycosyltransferase
MIDILIVIMGSMSLYIGILIIMALISNYFYKSLIIQYESLVLRKDLLKFNIEYYPSVLYFAIKRIIDIIFALISLVFTSPLLLISSLLIKFTSKGPIIISKRRTGLNGKMINCYNFRTFYINKELSSNTDNSCKPELTNIGIILIKLSVYNLPLLINVLMGQMSFVGRSNVLDYKDIGTVITENERQKIEKVKPGIISLCYIIQYKQIGIEKSSDEKISYIRKMIDLDLYYYYKRSLIMDAKIMFSGLIISLGKFSKM